MKQVELPGGTLTTQLGFGCANLLGGGALERSRSLIHAVLDAGIRHFDVAPVYGSGLAEDALGEALTGLAEPVTITTKVGLARPGTPAGSSRARMAAKAVLAMAPRLKQKLGRRFYRMSRRKAFGVEEAAASFEESLRRLRVERVDVLLLHEPDPEDLTEELLRWLEGIRAEGRAGAIGFGVSRAKMDQALVAWPGAEFVQTSWAVGDPVMDVGHRFLSTHGTLRAIERVRFRLKVDAEFRECLLAEIGADPDSRDVLAQRLLSVALANNPKGMTLVSTSRAERIGVLASATQSTPRPAPAWLT